MNNSYVKYNTVNVDGVSVFYRDAGIPTNPTIVLLHGFPSSSHMFTNLIPLLSDQFHVIAPDYHGFGNSGMPSVNSFAYTFENISRIIEKLLYDLSINQFLFYSHGFGDQ
jgi:pimeloyl-ACP methyl ester carboxylesterase